MPDPFTLPAADIQSVVDWMEANPNLKYVEALELAEAAEVFFAPAPKEEQS